VTERPTQQLEQVPIESVHVGDYVYVELEDQAPLGTTWRVIAKASVRRTEKDKIAGWRLVFAAGQVAWWPRGATVWCWRVSPARETTG